MLPNSIEKRTSSVADDGGSARRLMCVHTCNHVHILEFPFNSSAWRSEDQRSSLNPDTTHQFAFAKHTDTQYIATWNRGGRRSVLALRHTQDEGILNAEDTADTARNALFSTIHLEHLRFPFGQFLTSFYYLSIRFLAFISGFGFSFFSPFCRTYYQRQWRV
jgi:hypothetical protein